MTTSETITGVVEARNATGIRVHGAWHNVSRFRPIELPDVGAQVRLAVDGKGFLQTLEVLDGDQRKVEQSGALGERDRQIARLSVLKSAAAFAATRTDIKSADVLRIADAWLAWLGDSR